MTENEAEAIVADRFGAAKTARIAEFLTLVREENERQNLISPSTVDTVWTRHGLDSAQLMFHVEQPMAAWLDIGTGGGFPGMVVALLSDGPVTMVEPRKKRAEFLRQCVDRLDIANATVLASKVEAVTGSFMTISARAVASVEKLLQAAEHCATPETRWILPRGQIAADQLTSLRRDRTRLFHMEHSLTDPQSSILIVYRQGGRTR